MTLLYSSLHLQIDIFPGSTTGSPPMTPMARQVFTSKQTLRQIGLSTTPPIALSPATSGVPDLGSNAGWSNAGGQFAIQQASTHGPSDEVRACMSQN